MSSGEEDFSYRDFVRSRKLYWMHEAKEQEPGITVPPFEDIPLSGEDSNFMLSAKGPGSLYAVFEDAAETGWLYIYDASLKQILKTTHIYNRRQLDIQAEDVDIAWSDAIPVCGVAVWGQMRGFLGLQDGSEMRKPIVERESDGFYANEWPEGFAYLLSKRLNLVREQNGDGTDGY